MFHIPPAYLYKYKSLGRKVDVERTIAVIKTGRIFAAPLGKLNDPMEGKAVVPMSGFAGVSLSRSIEKLPARFSNDIEKCRVLSLSENPTSPQMWAYYANGYKGVCLQFERIPIEVEPVRYTRHPYHVGYTTLDSEDGNRIARARLLTKHADWSHEYEWRAVFIGDEVEDYVSMGEGNPSSVILGHKCDGDVAQQIVLACKERGIPVHQTYLSDWNLSIRIIPYGFEPARTGESLIGKC